MLDNNSYRLTVDAAYTLLVLCTKLAAQFHPPSSSPLQEEEISLFNKKKAAVQAQRAQSEREQLAKKTKK